MTQANNVGILTPKINASGQLDVTTGLTGATPVANGGTGASTLTANNVILGAGTSAVTFVAPSTTGNVLTSNGSTWTSAAAPAGGLGGTTVFTTNGTFTIPTGKTVVKVSMTGGGGGAAAYNAASQSNLPASSGGGAGTVIKYLTGLTPGNTLAVTVGNGGNAGTSGNAGSSGASSTVASGTQTITTLTATGGAGGPNSGSANTRVEGGAGGSGSNGDINVSGGTGGPAFYNESCPTLGFAGNGGVSALFSVPARGYGAYTTVSYGNRSGQAGVGYGCGGSAGMTDAGNVSSGAGAGGIVIFEY